MQGYFKCAWIFKGCSITQECLQNAGAQKRLQGADVETEQGCVNGAGCRDIYRVQGCLKGSGIFQVQRAPTPDSDPDSNANPDSDSDPNSGTLILALILMRFSS